MGALCFLVNVTKQEKVLFIGVNAGKAKELAGTHVAAAMTTWYMLENQGDEIGFVRDDAENWPFHRGSWESYQDYVEVTEPLISSMVAAGLLKDHGSQLIDGDPDLMERILEVVW
jgi:hypothetical protein